MSSCSSPNLNMMSPITAALCYMHKIEQAVPEQIVSDYTFRLYRSSTLFD